jgi:hypothetical protein
VLASAFSPEGLKALIQRRTQKIIAGRHALARNS